MKKLCSVTLFYTDNTITVQMMLDTNSPDIENVIYDTFGDIAGKDLYDYEVVDIKKLEDMRKESNRSKGGA
ncbi:MAG: hypothetical protein Unbinned627contig1001_7 [Prokaryotic dsDNA virus sp.]|jgi:hypothetical protein|nr:MAG: hypothetical protein Unbinned627contig1001_7 [Prokaryotic dsDNA virus sp.]|tara:strand:+ start:1596 stop:1808 length:213 start_codon:yes stop_codon:yes gene_type:complete